MLQICHLLKHGYVLFIVQSASYIPLALLMQINALDVSKHGPIHALFSTVFAVSSAYWHALKERNSMPRCANP